VISLPEVSSNTIPKWPVIVAFSNSSGVEWTRPKISVNVELVSQGKSLCKVSPVIRVSFIHLSLVESDYINSLSLYRPMFDGFGERGKYPSKKI